MKILLVTPITPEYRMCKRIFTFEKEMKLKGCKIGICNNNKDNIFAIQSGPGKARAAMATMAMIDYISPEIVIDTGSCAGITTKSEIGQIIIGDACVEYDISGKGNKKRCIKKMILHSAFHLFKASIQKTLLQDALRYASAYDFKVYSGTQASGKYLVNSSKKRRELAEICGADGCNWETAGVYMSALRSGLPVFSLRIVSDLGDAHAVKDFYSNIKKCAKTLYTYIRILLYRGWFADFYNQWKKVDISAIEHIDNSELP